MVKFILFMMSVLFVVSFVGFSCKPSPIYGGLGLIIGGGVGCGVVLYFGGAFLGLMVFLVYLGGMLVVFGYTTAMATEEFPEIWMSSTTVMGSLCLGLLAEGLIVVYLKGGDEKMWGAESLVMFSGEEVGFIREDYLAGSILYSGGNWMLLLSGWCLFVSVFIVMEITRGR
uniref:NADH-ubiquinone oxidoreductase chain 6 n=1 Tax=Echinops telfairi TaxID=9371 RepID=Q7YD87_ECHTE|nr:NADH dehydrogenase subunit 6 [Echinops telfairi]